MPEKVTIPARIDSELCKRLDTESAFADAVEEGRADLRAGYATPHDDVAIRFKARFGCPDESR